MRLFALPFYKGEDIGSESPDILRQKGYVTAKDVAKLVRMAPI